MRTGGIVTKYKNLIDLLDKNKPVIFYVFALNILLLIPSALSPVFKQVFTDYILTDGIVEWLAPLLALMAGTALLSASVSWMQKNCLLRLSNKIEIAGASRYMWTLLSSPLKLFSKEDSYRLLSQADASKRVSKLLTRDLLGLLFNVVSVAFYLVMMLRLGKIMTAVAVALVMLNFAMFKLQEYLSLKLARKSKPAQVPAELIMCDERISSAGLQNIETFKSTASETYFFQRMLGSKIAVINARKDQDFTESCKPFDALPGVVFLNLLLLISALRIMNRSFSIGSYLAFQAYASAFFVPLSEVLGAGGLFARLERRLKYLYSELSGGGKEEPRNQIPEGSTGKLEGYIEIDDVCFGYDGVPVLENISLSVKPGQRIAILGNSGAGKTTLLKLLQGLYTPDSGKISIDGIDPARMDKHLFANSIGCANQEITLFAASVRDNITMWDESVSDAEIYRAAGDACIHGHIASLDGAYDYRLSENGNNLSGGQRQRLEIARALLYNPSVVLLDEATSSIDPVNRGIIEDNLMKRGCACIAVTHVTSWITDYDEIIIMDKGRIVQRGTHETLLRTSAFYASVLQEEGAVAAV